MDDRFDVFISHAAEDKDDFVVPLARALKDRGLTVWIDDAEQIRLGDHIRQKTAEALSLARFGVVVLSPIFAKYWPERELRALFNEKHGKFELIPVVHRMALADAERMWSLERTAIQSADGVDRVAQSILERLQLADEPFVEASDDLVTPFSKLLSAISDTPARFDIQASSAHAAIGQRPDLFARSIWPFKKLKTIKALKQTRYLPITDLDGILRNPEIMRQLSPRRFEELVAELLDGLGYEDVRLTPQSGDGGIDVYATKRVDGIPIIVGCECKQYSDKVGVDKVRSLLGAVTARNIHATIGVLVTTSTFTRGAVELIGQEATLDGKDFSGVEDWIKSYTQKNLS